MSTIIIITDPPQVQQKSLEQQDDIHQQLAHDIKILEQVGYTVQYYRTK